MKTSESSDLLSYEDFQVVNFGILTCKRDGHSFIFQRPFPYDLKRHAQDSCVAIIDHGDPVDVEDLDEALEVFNKKLVKE